MRDYELYYEIVSQLHFLGINLLTSYCLGYYLKPFLAKKKIVLPVTAVYFAAMVFLYYVPWIIDGSVAYAIGVVLVLAVMVGLEPENISQKIFLSITFFSLRRISLDMENCIDALLYHYSYYIPGFDGNWDLQFALYVGESVIDLILSLVFMLFSIWLIQKAYIYKKEKMTKREMVILSIPSLSGIVGSEVLKYYNMMYENETGKYAYDINLACNWRCFLYYGICFVVILVMIVLFQEIKNRQNEEKQTELLFGQIADMKRHIGEVERLYREMQGLRHDMGNHIITLEGLCLKNENDAAVRYVAHLKDQLTEAAPKIKSGNPVTDVILAEMQKEAEEAGIYFASHFHYQTGSGIDVFDISVILNNALANAIEAARGSEGAFIRVTSRRKANAWLIEIKNSFAGEIVLEEESGLPRTSKRNEEGHGFGLANIRKVAQKYYGDISFVYDENVFGLTVMLMIP